MRPGAYDASKPVAPAPMSYGQFYEKTPYTRREHMHRVPIVMSGFMKYSGHSKDFLRGRFIGFEGVGLRDILRLWDKQKAQIGMDERFILVTNLNENWGFLSSSFPGRTSAWGRVDFEKFPALQSFLDDPRLLLLAIGQHSNISHPKVLMLPRGLPDTGGFSNHAARMMYDTMRLTWEKNVTKTKLLFTVSSSFGNRKTIVQCVKNNLPPALFDASGGTGGDGADGTGAGLGGDGGSGGSGGRVTFYQTSTASGAETFGSAGSTGNAHSGTTHGTGGSGNTVQVSL
jgi:hypothetical protein